MKTVVPFTPLHACLMEKIMITRFYVCMLIHRVKHLVLFVRNSFDRTVTYGLER